MADLNFEEIYRTAYKQEEENYFRAVEEHFAKPECVIDTPKYLLNADNSSRLNDPKRVLEGGQKSL